jgi:hypothetical protein
VNLLRIVVETQLESASLSPVPKWDSQSWPIPKWGGELEIFHSGRCTFFAPPASIKASRHLVASSLEALRTTDTPQELELIMRHAPSFLWDHFAGILTCTSLPLGYGTFFYTWLNKTLILSTSLHDISTLLPDLALDHRMVAEYFAFGRRISSCQSLTFLRGVAQIPPGHILRWTNDSLSIEPYWSLYSDPLLEQLSAEDSAEYVRSELAYALDTTLSQHRVACLVSGGLDSSLVAATANRHRPDAAALLTLGHGIDCPEERRLQRMLASHLSSKLIVPHHITPRLQIEHLSALNRTANAPSGGLFTGVYTQAIQEVSASGVTAIVTGEGGDEVFAPDPIIISDLLIRRKFRRSLEATAFFTSLDSTNSIFRSFYNSGILPIYATNIPATLHPNKTIRNSKNFNFQASLLGNFYDELATVRKTELLELQKHQSQGLSLSARMHYRQVIEIPFYEAAGPYHTESALVVINPLANIRVFRAAMSLRLDERVGTWVGFRPKRLLQTIATDILPPELYRQPKIGVSNLLAHMTQGIEEELIELLGEHELKEIGLNPAPHTLNPRTVPTNESLHWALLMTLTIWFKELKDNAIERRRHHSH